MEENILCPRCGSDKILVLLFGDVNTLEAFDSVGDEYSCEICGLEFTIEFEEN
jgi:DNA-directed RNA polymerase subunit RPC12/RpoP